MRQCAAISVPKAGDDPILIMELWANEYKLCKMKQQGLVKCIRTHNSAIHEP